MLPELVAIPGAPFRVLPPGTHWATLAEIRAKFGATEHRGWLFEGFTLAVASLRAAGCRQLFLDGSYVTGKGHPNDFDGCWDPSGVIASRLDPVLLDFTDGRAAQKQKYRGELFISGEVGGLGRTFFEFFQLDKHSGRPKGIVGLRLAPNIRTSR